MSIKLFILSVVLFPAVAFSHFSTDRIDFLLNVKPKGLGFLKWEEDSTLGGEQIFWIPAFKGLKALKGPLVAGMTDEAAMTSKNSSRINIKNPFFKFQARQVNVPVVKKDSSFINKKEAVEIIIHIEKGMSFQAVAKLLKQRGLINSVFSFRVLAWFRGESTKIQSGEYTFQKNTPSWKILDALVEGKTRLHRITFYEGYNMYEMAKILEEGNFLDKEQFISLCHDSDLIYELLEEKRDSLEGYLFPDTYYIPLPVEPEKLIRKMVQGFLKVYGRLSGEGLKKAAVGNVYLSRHELVILASIVEKETGLAKERPLIASVFYNRLNKKMRLESDPTILYGMIREAGGLVSLNIRKKDILRKTPYNTYRIFGFPAGPISNPGEESLKAVFEPANSSFLYFVSRNDGSHIFSKTYREHAEAVDRYQRKILKKK